MIYARSPYIVYDDTANLEDVEFNLYCYLGTSFTDRATGTKYEFAINAVNGAVEFDVSPYIREFLETQSASAQTNPFTNYPYTCWVYMEIDRDTGSGLSGSFSTFKTDTLASLGYSYFDDLVRYQAEPDQVITSANYYKDASPQTFIKSADHSLRLPMFKTPQLGGNDYRVYSYDGPNGTGSLLAAPLVTQSSPSELDDQIQIVTLPNGVVSFEYRDSASADVTQYNVIEVPGCKNGVTSVFFLNRYGAVEELHLFGRAIESYTTEGNSYKKSILSGGTYNFYDRQMTEINKRAKRRLQVSSGMYPENYNEQFKQMMMSTYVWLGLDEDRDSGTTGFSVGDFKPVILVDTDMTYKYSRYDKKIEYTFTFEFANSEIQDVA